MADLRPRRQEGFSTVELMVVLVIISILTAIAIPIFFGMRERARDTAAKASASLGLKTAKAFATDSDESFVGVTTASLQANEPSRIFLDGNVPSTQPREISQLVPDAGAGAQIFVVAVYSESGACYFARTLINGGTDFARTTGIDCRADEHASVAFGPSW